MKNKVYSGIIGTVFVVLASTLHVFATPTLIEKSETRAEFVNFSEHLMNRNDASSYDSEVETLSNTLFETDVNRTDQAEFVDLAQTKKETLSEILDMAKTSDWYFRQNNSLLPASLFTFTNEESGQIARPSLSVYPNCENSLPEISGYTEKQSIPGEEIQIKDDVIMSFHNAYTVIISASESFSPAVPEPSTLNLMLLGVITFFCFYKMFQQYFKIR